MNVRWTYFLCHKYVSRLRTTKEIEDVSVHSAKPIRPPLDGGSKREDGKDLTVMEHCLILPMSFSAQKFYWFISISRFHAMNISERHGQMADRDL